MRPLAPVLLLTLCVAPSIVRADEPWRHNVGFRYANATSLKVTSPADFAVSVTVAGDVRRDTIPAVFNLPDGDAFVQVAITSADGATWTQKIEIRSKQQTELKVDYQPAAKPHPANVRSYIGRLANSGYSCGKQYAVGAKFEFLRKSDGADAGFVELKSKKVAEVTLPKGSYDVRVHLAGSKGYYYLLTGSLELNADGWTAGLGCREGVATPSLLSQ